MANEFPITLASTLIAYYLAHPTFNTPDRFFNRIGVRAHYSDGWQQGKPGLTIRMDGGPPDMYTEQMRGLCEVRIYGATPEVCDMLYGLMEQDARNFERALVGNDAVLQSLIFETAASDLKDDDTNLSMYMFFISAAVRTESVLAA